jgi:hypothetical protein
MNILPAVSCRAKNWVWALFIGQLFFAPFVAHAQNPTSNPAIFGSWGQLPARGIPQINRSATHIAVAESVGPLAARTVSIYQVDPETQTSALAWNFYDAYPSSISHGFAWQGDQLVFSKSDTIGGKRLESLSEGELKALRDTPGKTFRVDVATKKVSEFLPHAYRLLAVDQSGDRLAGGAQVGTKKKGADLTFFSTSTGQPLGEWNQPAWPQISDDFPFLLDWSPDGSGVFVVGPRVVPPGETDPFVLPNLFFVTVQGELKAAGPKFNSMVSGYEGMLPLGVVSRDNKATAVYVNNNGLLSISRSSQDKTERSYTWTAVEKIFSLTATPSPILEPVAITPNGRMVLAQVPKVTTVEDEAPAEAEFWLLDFEGKRRRKLGTYPHVKRAYSWRGDRLIVAVKVAGARGNETTLAWFRLPEAVLLADSPQFQQIVGQGPWEAAPQPAGPTLETAVAQFLRQKELWTIPAPESWQRGVTPTIFPRGLTPVSPRGQQNEDAVLGIDEKTLRVKFFRAPLPTEVAETPVAPEVAAKAAEAFARSNFPMLFAAGGTTQVRAGVVVNKRANYSVEVQRVEQGIAVPTRALIEVSASDGKIAGYAEEETPLTATLETPTSSEQAKQAATAKHKARDRREIGQWVLERQEVVTLSSKQQVVWHLVAALQHKPQQDKPQDATPTAFADFIVSGETGQVLESEVTPVSPALMSAYRARGGVGAPSIQELESLTAPQFRDSFPRVSPTGQVIAFLSNRPRRGVPEWWTARPQGVFLVNKDGSGLRMVAPSAQGPVQWSPGGRYIAFPVGQRVAAYDLLTNKPLALPPTDAGLELKMPVWTTEDTLLLVGQPTNSMAYQLLQWQPSRPQEPLKTLSASWVNALAVPSRVIEMARSHDGKTLWLLMRKPNDTVGACPYALYAQPITQPLSKPTIFADCLPFADHLQVTSDGLFVSGTEGILKIDLPTKKFTPWKLPPGPATPPFSGREMFDRIGFFPDGRTLVWAAPQPTQSKEGASIIKQSLFLFDGETVKPLVP